MSKDKKTNISELGTPISNRFQRPFNYGEFATIKSQAVAEDR